MSTPTAPIKLDETYGEWERAGVSPFFPVIEANTGTSVRTDKHEALLMFGSCDYLGLSQEPALKAAAVEAVQRFGTNTYGAQLLCGHTRIHRDVEEVLGGLSALSSAVLFPSGMAANLAVITALAGPDDVVINDRTDHVSIFMGSKLSGAEVRTFPHNNTARLEQLLRKSADKRRRVVVVDGLYSADGDYAPLDEIVRLAKAHDALVVVDEAHSFGVVGPTGLGVAEHFGVLDQVDVVVGTMSKALGSVGGFVLTTPLIEPLLRYLSPSYTSSRGSAPGVVGATLASLNHLALHGPTLRARLQANVTLVLGGLRAAGVDVLNTRSHIVPVLVGDEDKTIAVANWLMERGVFTAAFVHPHVPARTGRLRVGITAAHTTRECESLVALLVRAKHEFTF
ncbi:8-amino-7-oxononanoate synthase [Actinokineospora baliensis]|uniref:aminotransferase class I/II-fold pyridoxal phosphate-dependent enzyme n=1 Tax=Actinokineospora baliensis TaxID=547056 RepID=UPI00195EDC17|nr:pyridoxal phosphate-dependent aminotransferase family protein [Actinokineospora baliensis]MBM7773496.1 8-amino-7-oxononanoate synthase [Actinokineospora baliensis]